MNVFYFLASPVGRNFKYEGYVKTNKAFPQPHSLVHDLNKRVIVSVGR